MRAFVCEVCGAELFFENSVCVSCGSAVGYSREQGRLVAVTDDQPICANLNLCGCNWIADPSSALGLCFSCRLTRTRPADADAVYSALMGRNNAIMMGMARPFTHAEAKQLAAYISGLPGELKTVPQSRFR